MSLTLHFLRILCFKRTRGIKFKRWGINILPKKFFDYILCSELEPIKPPVSKYHPPKMIPILIPSLPQRNVMLWIKNYPLQSLLWSLGNIVLLFLMESIFKGYWAKKRFSAQDHIVVWNFAHTPGQGWGEGKLCRRRSSAVAPSSRIP